MWRADIPISVLSCVRSSSYVGAERRSKNWNGSCEGTTGVGAWFEEVVVGGVGSIRNMTNDALI